jgi:SacI homology domain
MKEGLSSSSAAQNLYFAYNGELTLTKQRYETTTNSDSVQAQHVWSRADSRFFWNASLSKPLLGAYPKG